MDCMVVCQDLRIETCHFFEGESVQHGNLVLGGCNSNNLTGSRGGLGYPKSIKNGIASYFVLRLVYRFFSGTKMPRPKSASLPNPLRRAKQQILHCDEAP